MVKPENAYEVWQGFGMSQGWTWYVLKKWQADDDAECARWHCLVKSPFTPEGEYGDEYVSEIKSNAKRIK